MASSDVLAEEFEVLDSIFPDEIAKISERELEVTVRPDVVRDDSIELSLLLHLKYPTDYPDALPEMNITAATGDLTQEEKSTLLTALTDSATENLGMAFTFTLISYLQEQMDSLINLRAIRVREQAAEVERTALLAEEERTRGTPVTVESFKTWKDRFDSEVASAKSRHEDERLRGLSGKDRDEIKRVSTRQTGKQLFEKNKDLDDSDAVLLEDGAVAVDFTQFERQQYHEEIPKSELHLSDSD